MIISLVNAVARFIGRTIRAHQEEHPVPATAVDRAWDAFLASRHMGRILHARKPRDLPRSPKIWKDCCEIACELWVQLEAECVLHYIPTVFPALCLLLKGTYYMHLYEPKEARDMIVYEDDPFANILNAICESESCPTSFVRRVLTDGLGKKEDLLVLDGNGRNPLHLLCRRGTQQSIVKLLSKHAPEALTQSDFNGNYPLHYACLSGTCTWRKGIKNMTMWAPQVTTLRSPENLQLPLHSFAYARVEKREDCCKKSTVPKGKTAAMTVVAVPCESEESSEACERERYDAETVETLFGLLRFDPTIVREWKV